MTEHTFAGLARTLRATGHAMILGLGAACATAYAATDIQVWHTLAGPNRAEFEKLVKQFNRDQKDVRVVLRGFDSQAALREETGKALAAKKAPHLVQIADNHSPEVIAEHKNILPMYRLLDDYPIRDLAWFLPQTSNFVRDSRGRLLAFPFMAEVPVMFYNLDAYKKAGLDPKAPARTWNDLQAELLQLRASGVHCPYATSDAVKVHLANLAPVNGKLYATSDNGLGKGQPKLNFDSLYMRHISLMVSWTRSMLLTEHPNDNTPDASFAKGACSVLTSGTGALGQLQAAKGLSFGVAPLPYYPQVAKQPGRPFVSGSALWAIAGHPRSEDKASATFLAYLATPVVAAQWHQQTGYLPLTEAAFRASDVSFYNKIPGAHQLIEALRTQPSPSSRGFRLNNYPQIETVMNTELQNALTGQTPPMRALNNISEKASALMR
ncbi:extracellular solute-binding protein [Orrella sp. JC864]|uniref:extracellular solute-binding protein n=1 Tax=Orrella sp. JC864 TaxID=3120298 RepID=UPI0030083D3C